MRRLGCCMPGGSFMPEGEGATASAYSRLRLGYDTIMNAGYDYAEATVGLLMELEPAELDRLVSEGVVIEVANSFIPPSLPIVSTPVEKLEVYVDEAMRRLVRLGGRLIIFGSGKARSLGGDPKNIKYLENFLALCSRLGEKHGVTVALEPLNARETDFMNYVSEGYELMKRLGLPNIALLADAFHMYCGNEPISNLSACTDAIVHVHVSEPDRTYPGASGGEYLRAFAAGLDEAGYAARVTVECSFSDFAAECTKAYEFMKVTF